MFIRRNGLAASSVYLSAPLYHVIYISNEDYKHC